MTNATILFEAVYRGDPVIITHATQDEIGFLAGTVDSAGDLLELWSFIAVRFGPAVEVHARGWRLLFANAWIDAAHGDDSASSKDATVFRCFRSGPLESAAVAGGSITATCETDQEAFVMLPVGRLLHVPRPMKLILA